MRSLRLNSRFVALTPLAPTAARQLREHCRIVGAMVGALAGFRQQDAVHGMPLQLTPEELTLAASKGALVASSNTPSPYS